MQNSEARNFRHAIINDPTVWGAFDSNFWHGDTANLAFDTTKNMIKIGDTALVGSVSSFSQYLFGDFEFTMAIDSLSPDSNDSVKYFGLRNAGDSNNRGAAFFDLAFDTLTGADTTITRPFRAVAYDEAGNRTRKNITWDTNWGGGGRLTRFRILWEEDGYNFLVNDTLYATLGGEVRTGQTTADQINTAIPQAIRLSNRSLDTTDTAATSLKLLVIRNARIVNPKTVL